MSSVVAVATSSISRARFLSARFIIARYFIAHRASPINLHDIERRERSRELRGNSRRCATSDILRSDRETSFGRAVIIRINSGKQR
jgi:hypothetical protein